MRTVQEDNRHRHPAGFRVFYVVVGRREGETVRELHRISANELLPLVGGTKVSGDGAR